jgi:hypothetical protein
MHVRAPRLRLCLPLAPSPPAASSRHGTTDGSRRSTARASTATGERKSHHHLVAALPRRTWLPLLTRLVGRPTGYYSVLLLLQHPSTKLFPRTKYGVLRTTRIIQVQKGLRTAWHGMAGWLLVRPACTAARLHCTASCFSAQLVVEGNATPSYVDLPGSDGPDRTSPPPPPAPPRARRTGGSSPRPRPRHHPQWAVCVNESSYHERGGGGGGRGHGAHGGGK